MNILQRNNVRIFGRGVQPMIFAHGFGCDQTMWRYLTPQFLDRYRIVLFDHVGAGHSDITAYNSDKYSSLDRYAEDLLEICRFLDLHQAVFVGHSVGAMIGILAAIQAPDYFKNLILIGPSPCYCNEPGYTGGFERADIEALLEFMAADYAGWATTFAPLVMGTPDQPSLAAELAESFCTTDSTIARQFARVTFLSDNRPDLPKVQTPSLILQCSEDLIAPSEVGDYMHQHLTNATLVTLNATGHCPNLSAPIETAAAMEAYLFE